MLLILGLDGATLDLVGPWVADGTLPNLARLMRAGAWGRLASTVPPGTFPSWTSFMTGVNPGRHGIFDFSQRQRGAYRVHFVNATHRKAPTVWRLLSDAGRRVSVLGLPGTYPPESVNGYMVSGFDTPVTMRAEASFVTPPAFASELDRLGGFPFADFQEFHIGPSWHAQAIPSLLAGIEKKARLAETLLTREPWDCLMLLLGESDTVAHHFWAFHDPQSPRFDAERAAALANPIRTVYAVLDELVGRLTARVPAAHVMVVSDHGFGGAGDTAVYLNRWLAEQGWLVWSAHRGVGKLARSARAAAVRAIPEQWQARCFRFAGGRLASRLESGVRFGGIDWRETQAFSEELNLYPSIWLNVQGREMYGTVAADRYRPLCEEIKARLLEWRDPLHQARVVRRVWHREEVYWGPYVDLAPDLVLELATPGGYSYVCLPSGGDGPPIERLPPEALKGGKLRGMSGSHRPDGVFVLAGRGIASGQITGASIVDMAPTILSLCGMSAPSNWDGRVLSCVERVTRESPLGVPWQADPREVPYGVAEERCLQMRLAQLGYFE